ncbi:ECF-type sigma factor [Rheinheimera mangrovi]|uniref:ECF-type sigma factor n=1 Tax=Rheinheimera mangrovi TaxID=2498451 RepID=UPI000F8CFC59|nr:ECF-type sigma factor [Rheinheimera mangrovi]
MPTLTQELKRSNRKLLSSLDIYSQLKAMARNTKEKFVEGELEHHSTTALVHEVYLKLSQSSTQLLTDDQKELLKQLAQAVRSVVIDLLRKQRSQKRSNGGFEPEPEQGLDADTLLKIDSIIQHMEHEFPEQAQAAVLYHFNSMKVPHIASVLNLSEPTVYSYLNFFKRYVQVELAQ